MARAPSNATGLVRTVHNLRKRPVGSLNAYEMGRMIGQNEGIPWLLPMALEILRNAAAEESLGDFFDDDLLTAVLTRGSDVWRRDPQLAVDLKEILLALKNVSPYIQSNIGEFFAAIDQPGERNS